MTYLQERTHILGVSSVSFYHHSDQDREHDLMVKVFLPWSISQIPSFFPILHSYPTAMAGPNDLLISLFPFLSLVPGSWQTPKYLNEWMSEWMIKWMNLEWTSKQNAQILLNEWDPVWKEREICRVAPKLFWVNYSTLGSRVKKYLMGIQR